MDANHALRAAEAPPVDGFGSVLALEGAFDYLAAPAVSAALESEDGNVIVDLSGCTVLDPSVIRALLLHSRTLQRAHQRLEIVVPPENRAITRLFEILCIASIIPLRRRRVDARTVHVLSGSGSRAS